MDAVLKNVREESAGLAWVFFPTDESESCVSYRAILKIHKMQILKKFSMGNGFRHIFFLVEKQINQFRYQRLKFFF